MTIKHPTVAITAALTILGTGAEAKDMQTMQLPTPVSQSGTITLVLRTDRRYFNGQGQQNCTQTTFAPLIRPWPANTSTARKFVAHSTAQCRFPCVDLGPR